MKQKLILHLCADIGSDSRIYHNHSAYKVIRIGEEIGVENYEPPRNVYGVIANPPCTKFSTAGGFHIGHDLMESLALVKHCERIIAQCEPRFWVIENPAKGRLKEYLGTPQAVYQPYQYGSPWTKETALWGDFNMPAPLYKKWSDVPKELINPALYVRPGRNAPALAFLHKSALEHITEFQWARKYIYTDADFRSLCSQKFAKAFFHANR